MRELLKKQMAELEAGALGSYEKIGTWRNVLFSLDAMVAGAENLYIAEENLGPKGDYDIFISRGLLTLNEGVTNPTLRRYTVLSIQEQVGPREPNILGHLVGWFMDMRDIGYRNIASEVLKKTAYRLSGEETSRKIASYLLLSSIGVDRYARSDVERLVESEMQKMEWSVTSGNERIVPDTILTALDELVARERSKKVRKVWQW